MTQCERHKKQEQGRDKNKNANNRTQDANKNETRCKQERKKQRKLAEEIWDSTYGKINNVKLLRQENILTFLHHQNSHQMLQPSTQ